MDDQACENTDRELWREREGDAYADSIHVTANGGIGMNVGGYVIVMPIRKWHAAAKIAYEPLAREMTPAERAKTECLTRALDEEFDAILARNKGLRR